MKNTFRISLAALVLTVVAAGIGPNTAQAGDWSISIWGGTPYYVQPGPPYTYYYHEGYPRYRYGRGYDYYPYYRQRNPVVTRDYYREGGYAPDGSYHSEDVVEDRRASYFSPGRNQAITPPRTSVQTWNQGPWGSRTRERTSWIGADGRPHSTTIDRVTTQDPYGNTHTDTYVELKNKAVSGGSGGGGAVSELPANTSTNPPALSTPSAREPVQMPSLQTPSVEAPSAPPATSGQ